MFLNSYEGVLVGSPGRAQPTSLNPKKQSCVKADEACLVGQNPDTLLAMLGTFPIVTLQPDFVDIFYHLVSMS